VHALVFPKLTFLLLETLDFNCVMPDSGVLFNLVRGVVERRRAIKAPLTTLRINHCMISAKEAGKLKKVVPDFQWDHDEGEGEGKSEGEGVGEDDDDDEDDYDYEDDYEDISDPGLL